MYCDSREDTAKFIASDIAVVEGLDENAPPLRLKLSPLSLNETLIDKLKRLLELQRFIQRQGRTAEFEHTGFELFRDQPMLFEELQDVAILAQEHEQ